MKINTTESEGKITKDNEYAGRKEDMSALLVSLRYFLCTYKKIFLRYALCYVARKTPTRKYTNRVESRIH